MNPADYRSPDLPRGYFRRLNSLHMHIDGGSESESVIQLLHEAKERGIAAKLTRITKAVPGPQRAEQPETYQTHTPGPLQNEDFNYFASIALSDRKSAISSLKTILPRLLRIPHFVVEVERVVAATEGDSPWTSIQELERPLTLREIGYSPAVSLPIEIHHGFDTPAEHAGCLSVDRVLSEVTGAGISVGGWFVFDRAGGDLCFRSNAFSPRTNYLAKAAKQHEMLTDYLRKKHIAYNLWTTVEHILGIWNSTKLNDALE